MLFCGTAEGHVSFNAQWNYRKVLDVRIQELVTVIGAKKETIE